MTRSKSLDKFYTKEEAAVSFIEFVKKYVDLSDFENIIEPSAGAGAILKHLPVKALGVDLEPEDNGAFDIIKSDFFDFEYPKGKTITIGNPPFGNRSKLAIEFFNKATLHSDVVAFIVPVTWEKFSIHKQLTKDWALIATERLPEESFELDGKPYRVRCCMQVWLKNETGIDKLKKKMADFIKDKPISARYSPAYRSMRFELYTLGSRPKYE
ncbi:MAG: hypothetical protein ACRCZZ_07610 [Phocaeicola sp.]